MGVGNNIKDKGQRKVTFRLKPECWEGVSHTKKNLEEEGRSFKQRKQQVQRSWGENELAYFFLEQKDGGQNTVSTEYGRKMRAETSRGQVTYDRALYGEIFITCQ